MILGFTKLRNNKCFIHESFFFLSCRNMNVFTRFDQTMS